MNPKPINKIPGDKPKEDPIMPQLNLDIIEDFIHDNSVDELSEYLKKKRKAPRKDKNDKNFIQTKEYLPSKKVKKVKKFKKNNKVSKK